MYSWIGSFLPITVTCPPNFFISTNCKQPEAKRHERSDWDCLQKNNLLEEQLRLTAAHESGDRKTIRKGEHTHAHAHGRNNLDVTYGCTCYVKIYCKIYNTSFFFG